MDGLIKAIRHTNLGIRWRAADALGNIGIARALEPLQKLKQDKDEYVRRAAEDAIEKIHLKNRKNS